MRIGTVACRCVVGVFILSNVSGLRAAAPEPVSAGDALLAEKFCEIAQGTLRVKQITKSTWAESAALLEAAMRLNPSEPRYPRLLADLMLETKDTDGALAALSAFRKLKPHDQVPQVQAIDLYASKIETAEKQVEYLKDVANKSQIAPEVRSHAAVRCAKLLMERSQRDQADLLVTLALRLNPVNVEALRLRYDLSFKTMLMPEKVALLLAMVRANPAQFTAISALADLLSDVGLVDQSLAWYEAGVNLAQRARAAMPPDFLLAYAQELFIGDQMKPADDLVTALLRAQPDNIDSWYLKVLIATATSDKPGLERAKRGVLNALANRLAVARKDAGDASATTRPIESPADIEIGDPVADAKKLKEANKPELIDHYVSAAADLAWFQIYFNNQPDAASKLLDALKLLLPEDSVTRVRLEGWSYLASGKTPEASVKLSAIAQRDPLAALGMLRVSDAEHSATTQPAGGTPAARRLMNDNPSGSVGVILWGELRGRGVQLVSGPNADAIRGELANFPMPWLRISDHPTDFYVVRADGLQVSHSMGEPMMGRITIQNISDMPITIGAEEILHPDIWIDAQTRGLAQQNFPGVAFDRMTEALVLPPREGITHTVRVDQGTLSQYLSSQPGISIQIVATVMTNPVLTDRGVFAGPAGYRVQFSKLMEHTGLALTSPDAKDKITKAMASTSPDERMRTMELMATYVLVLRSQKMVPGEQGEKLQQQLKVMAQEFSDRIGKAREDSDASVRSWAQYLSSALAPTEADRTRIIDAMATSDDWQTRALAVIAARRLPPEEQTRIASSLARSDPNDIVKKEASAAESRRREATTQSADQPASQPAIEAIDLPSPTTAPSSFSEPLNTTKPSTAP